MREWFCRKTLLALFHFETLCLIVRKVAVIGGGLAGLITSIQLVRAGIACTVYEKKSYPFHRVCGEYVSNEARPFLTASGLLPKEFSLPDIAFLLLSSVRGDTCKLGLDLGGFGVSRYTFDHFLYEVAMREGVAFNVNTEVQAVNFADDQFSIEGTFGRHCADVVVGAFGKRSRLDIQQDRAFMRRRSPWIGVKYHVIAAHPTDTIALHNFPGGYCGVCSVDQGVTNLCYLSHRENLRRCGDLKTMEKEVLFRNPHLLKIFSESTFLFDRPQVINEVSFALKAPVENHMLMAGDAAGMITPVCGNGMAMAIHSATLASSVVKAYITGSVSRDEMEARYRSDWNMHFRRRLLLGRSVQHLFGKAVFSSMLVYLARTSRTLATAIIRQTHGHPF